jgi:hypothetical protein
VVNRVFRHRQFVLKDRVRTVLSGIDSLLSTQNKPAIAGELPTTCP